MMIIETIPNRMPDSAEEDSRSRNTTCPTNADSTTTPPLVIGKTVAAGSAPDRIKLT